MAGQELALTGGSLNVATCSQVCSRPLWSLATAPAGEGQSDSYINEICSLPALHREAVVIAKDFERMTFGCTLEGMKAALQRVALMWPPKDIPPKLLPAYWETYHAELRKLPVEAIRHAGDRYIATATFRIFPMPSEILRFAGEITGPILIARYRIMEAARRPLRPQISPEQKAKNAEAFKAMAAQIGSAPPAGPEDRTPGRRYSVADRIAARRAEC